MISQLPTTTDIRYLITDNGNLIRVNFYSLTELEDHRYRTLFQLNEREVMEEYQSCALNTRHCSKEII